jgi:hypothetical protein
MNSTNGSNPFPWYAPRIWHGMCFGEWAKLLARYGFRVSPSRLGLAATITMQSVSNSVLAGIQRTLYSRRVTETSLVAPPLFLVGHWRSGTTYLHELLACDERFATPTTYQCFAAPHFLASEKWAPKLLWFVLPSRRPMDNVRFAWSAPQEDEFALCSLGIPSPYLKIAFPNEEESYLDFLDLERLSPQQFREWQDCLRHFLKCVTLSTGKRIALKSPTHTSRIGFLAREYPGAKFLHIARHPVTVFLSTVNLWRVLIETNGLQVPRDTDYKEFVLSTLERMYAAYNRQRETLAPGQLVEIRYEDLVQDPVGVLRGAYERLDLGDFSTVEPALRAATRSSSSYRTNEYQLDESIRAEIMSRWAGYAARFGYSS